MNMSNPDTLVKEIRSRFDHATQKKLLKEKYASKMVFAHAGGMWRAGPELLTTLHICKESNPIVLLDLYETPVKIVPIELFAQASQIWQEQMNAWLIEHTELTRQR